MAYCTNNSIELRVIRQPGVVEPASFRQIRIVGLRNIITNAVENEYYNRKILRCYCNEAYNRQDHSKRARMLIAKKEAHIYVTSSMMNESRDWSRKDEDSGGGGGEGRREVDGIRWDRSTCELCGWWTNVLFINIKIRSGHVHNHQTRPRLTDYSTITFHFIHRDLGETHRWNHQHVDR